MNSLWENEIKLNGAVIHTDYNAGHGDDRPDPDAVGIVVHKPIGCKEAYEYLKFHKLNKGYLRLDTYEDETGVHQFAWNTHLSVNWDAPLTISNPQRFTVRRLLMGLAQMWVISTTTEYPK